MQCGGVITGPCGSHCSAPDMAIAGMCENLWQLSAVRHCCLGCVSKCPCNLLPDLLLWLRLVVSVHLLTVLPETLRSLALQHQPQEARHHLHQLQRHSLRRSVRRQLQEGLFRNSQSSVQQRRVGHAGPVHT